MAQHYPLRAVLPKHLAMCAVVRLPAEQNSPFEIVETNSFLAALNMREYLSERVQNDIQYSASIRNLAHSSVRRKANVRYTPRQWDTTTADRPASEPAHRCMVYTDAFIRVHASGSRGLAQGESRQCFCWIRELMRTQNFVGV
jgi:hypothetical protein